MTHSADASGRTARIRSLFLRHIPVFVGLSLLLTVGGCSQTTSDRTLTRIEAGAVADRLSGSNAERTLIIDTRTADAYRVGHIPAAVNLRLEDLAAGRSAGIDRYPVVIVYGENPGSATATAMCKRLQSLGYSGVRLFEGGMDAWRRAGLPIARDD